MHKCQQFELYDAEDCVDKGRRFANHEEAERWVNALRDAPWWQRSYEAVRFIEVQKSPRQNASTGGWFPAEEVGVMEMANDHLDELTLLHELAHVLAEYRYGSHSHCPWFARTYLELVAHVLGSQRYLELQQSFQQHGIDYSAQSTTAAGIAL